MKSNIVFFDSIQNSKRGTLRGAVILPFLLLFSAIWYLVIMKSVYEKHIDDVNMTRRIGGVIVIAFFIISALGVHNPDTERKAVFFGGLLGLILYGSWNAVLLMTSKKWPFGMALIDVTWGVISTAILALILYHFVKNHKGLQPV